MADDISETEKRLVARMGLATDAAEAKRSRLHDAAVRSEYLPEPTWKHTLAHIWHILSGGYFSDAVNNALQQKKIRDANPAPYVDANAKKGT